MYELMYFNGVDAGGVNGADAGSHSYRLKWP